MDIESSAHDGSRREGRCPRPEPLSGGGGRRGRGPRCQEVGECSVDDDCPISTQKCCGKYISIVFLDIPQRTVCLS